MMLNISVLLVVVAFFCALISLATPKVHPSVAVLLLCVLELLRTLPR